MRGYVKFKGNKETFSTTGSIPFAAVKVFLAANPGAEVDDVWNTFEPGLVGKGRNTMYPFIMTESDWSRLRDQSRHYRETLMIDGVPYRVSKEFGYDRRGIIPFEEYLSKNKPGDKFIFVHENYAIPYGNDVNLYYVRYKEDIPDEKKVRGLTKYIESEYERILGTARYLLGAFLPDDGLIRIPVILSDENPVDIYKNDDEAIANMLHHQVQIYGCELSREQILSILKRKTMTCSRIGEYFHFGASVWNNFVERCPFGDGFRPYIVIYYNNISATGLNDYKARISQALAHEYMHFVHDLCAVGTFGNTSYDATAVKESLADFFSVLYLLNSCDLLNEKRSVVRDCYNSWNDYFGSNWPYANALWYYYIGGNRLPFTYDLSEYQTNGCIEKFIRVFKDSRLDMGQAYSELVRM